MNQTSGLTAVSNSSAFSSQPLNPIFLRSKKILIIEDEYDIGRLLAHRLEFLGAEVRVAGNGFSGLEAALTTVPDLVLLDLLLPGLSGEAICKALRESADETIAAIPIIMMSAKDRESDQIVGRVIGANAYVTKPFEFPTLLQAIRGIWS